MEQQIQVVNWRNVNAIVYRTLNFLRDTYPEDVLQFLRWYEQREGSPLPVTNPEMINWIVAGIPRVKRIVELLSREIEKLNRKIDQILSQRGRGAELFQRARPLQEGINLIKEEIIRFIGCRQDMSLWFLGFLNSIASRRIAARNALEYFTDVCLRTRVEVLR